MIPPLRKSQKKAFYKTLCVSPLSNKVTRFAPYNIPCNDRKTYGESFHKSFSFIPFCERGGNTSFSECETRRFG